jgi:hypothetical protein
MVVYTAAAATITTPGVTQQAANTCTTIFLLSLQNVYFLRANVFLLF